MGIDIVQDVVKDIFYCRPNFKSVAPGQKAVKAYIKGVSAIDDEGSDSHNRKSEGEGMDKAFWTRKRKR